MNDLIIRLALQGVAIVTGGVNDSAQAVERLDDALDAAGDNKGLEDVADGADKAKTGLDGAEKSAGGLNLTLEQARNGGAILAGLGAAGLALSQSFIDASKEGRGLEARLDSILEAQGRLGASEGINDAVSDVTVRGHFDDDDSIRDAAIHLASFSVEAEHIEDLLPRVARQVRTGFGDMTSIADGFGKSYANLDLAPLSRSGLVFTDIEKASLDAAKGISEAAGRAKFMEIVLAAVDRNTVSLEGSLTAAEAAANDLARATDDAMTQVGDGAAAAQTGVNSVLASILTVANNAPALEYAAGYLGYFVSGGAAAVGSLLTVGSQVAITAASLSSMGITGVGAWTAIRTAAVAAGTATWAAMAPLLPLLAAIAAGVLVVVGAYYLLYQYLEQDNLRNIEAGNAAGQQLLDIENRKRARRGQKQLTMEEFQGDPNSDDTSSGMDVAQLGNLQGQVAKMQSGAVPVAAIPAMPMATMPATTTATPSTPVPVVPVSKSGTEKTDDPGLISNKPKEMPKELAAILDRVLGGGINVAVPGADVSRETGGSTRRSGTAQLRETGRRTGSNGRELLDVVGTLELAGGRTANIRDIARAGVVKRR